MIPEILNKQHLCLLARLLVQILCNKFYCHCTSYCRVLVTKMNQHASSFLEGLPVHDTTRKMNVAQHSGPFDRLNRLALNS